MKQNLSQNKTNTIDFYKMAYNGNPRKAVELYVGSQYIQHNPAVGDGSQAFIEYFEKMNKEYPSKSIVFVRAIAEGDLVALHTHQTWPGNDKYITMDFFRFDDNGKLLNIGMQFKEYLKNQPTEMKCTEDIKKDLLLRKSF